MSTKSGKLIKIENDIESINKNDAISSYGDQARPLISISENNGNYIRKYLLQTCLLIIFLGQFSIRNDTFKKVDDSKN